MSKDDAGSGKLFSKVAKFVRHPTVDWSDLDQRTQGMDAEREALKAAIQRKRRNDKVRHNELNHLRAVMMTRRQVGERSTGGQTSGDSSSGVSSVFQPQPGSAADTAKSRTIEQIARIEQQMSQNWLRRRQEGDQEGLRIGSGTTMPASLDGGLTQPAHLGAMRSPTPGQGIRIDVVASDPNAAQQADAALGHAGIAEAAVRFANGEFDAAETGLRSLMVQEPLSMTARVAGLALLDLLHARRDFEGFEEFAAEFAERYGVPVPRWPTDIEPTQEEVAATGTAQGVAGSGSWTCPLFLDLAAVQALSRVMAAPGEDKWIDWTGLLSADVAAAHTLLEQVNLWVARPVALHFLGSAVLRRRLKASTPSGRRENEQVWWLLRLAMLRAMHRRDEFDLVALDYCVTYGVLPPEWSEPTCRFDVADTMPPSVAEPEATIQPLSTQMAGLDVLEWPSMMNTVQGSDTQFPSATTQMSSEWPTTLPAVSGASVRLCGYLTGDMHEAIAALDQSLGMHSPDKVFVIDCHLLERVDFTAAGTLLQWLMAGLSQGVQVELRGVSRLVAAFFHVVGIDEAVSVRLRQY